VTFADAQHLSAEFMSRFLFDWASLPSLALGTNNSALSEIGNEYGFEQVFAQESFDCIPCVANPCPPNIIFTSGLILRMFCASNFAKV